MDKTEENQDKVLAKDNQKINNKAKKQKWSLKKKIIVIVGAILVFIIALIVIASLATSAPLKVSDEFIADIQTGKASAAYDLMSSDGQIKTSSQDFTAVVDQIGPILTGEPKMTSKEASAETGSNPQAEIIYEIKGSDNLTYEVSVQLTQEEGQWNVKGFNSEHK